MVIGGARLRIVLANESNTELKVIGCARQGKVMAGK